MQSPQENMTISPNSGPIAHVASAIAYLRRPAILNFHIGKPNVVGRSAEIHHVASKDIRTIESKTIENYIPINSSRDELNNWNVALVSWEKRHFLARISHDRDWVAPRDPVWYGNVAIYPFVVGSPSNLESSASRETKYTTANGSLRR